MKRLRGCAIWAVGAFAVMALIGIWTGGGQPASQATPVAPVPTFTNTAPAPTVEPTATSAPPIATEVQPTTTTIPPTVMPEPPTPVPTETPVVLPASAEPAPAVRSEGIILPVAACDCSGNSLNCGDFTRRSEAQACFDYCMATVGSDVHELDANNDRVACESLPN